MIRITVSNDSTDEVYAIVDDVEDYLNPPFASNAVALAHEIVSGLPNYIREQL